MSLSVRIKRFKTLKTSSSKYVCVEFRNMTLFSAIYKQKNEYLEMNETFQWDLMDIPLNPGELLEVYLVGKTAWKKNKVLGVYRLGMQVPVSEHSIEIIDVLVNHRSNKATSTFVEMQICYNPADESRRLADQTAGSSIKTPVTSIPLEKKPGKPRKVSVEQASNLLTSITHQPLNSQRTHFSPLTSTSLLATTQKVLSNTPLHKKTPPTPQHLTHTPLKSQQVIKTTPLRTSPILSQSSAEVMPTVHTSPTARRNILSPTWWQAITSPARSALTSPGFNQDSTPPQAYVAPPLPTAFHKALEKKYGIKKKKDQQSCMQKPSGSVPSSSQRGSLESSSQDSSQSSAAQSDNADTDSLIQVERNIATLEGIVENKDALIDINSGDDNTNIHRRGGKLKQIGARVLSNQWYFGKSGAERAVKYVPPSEMVPAHKSKKKSTFRTIKNLMRLGRNKNHENSGDEELGLLDVAAGTSEPDAASSSQTCVSPVELPTVTKRKSLESQKLVKKECSIIEPEDPIAKRTTEFQIAVTIIEARQLVGLNINPFVAVQVGEDKKCTRTKESTNCPYYDESFVFDFNVTPIVLFEKIITLSVQQSRNMLRSNKLIGSFKIDVATLWSQPDHQFYHKWALLTDPEDITSGPKGYLKCDISVICKGTPTRVPPPKGDKDDDDIEANLLLPAGMPVERHRARFVVTVHKADGLPKMNYSIVGNMKRAFTGEGQDLVDPYVEVSFAGTTGLTSVLKNTNSPVWNEQIVFTEMFPPLCQRIKIQLKDNVTFNHSNVIGTHFIDIRKISNDGDKGFLPTFGPAYVYLYGSTRDYSLIDQHSGLNDGMSEGVSYRGRILISIRTDIMDILELPESTEVEIESVPPITDTTLGKNTDFFLFGCVFEANMIDKQLIDKPLSFELSIGNSGNSLDDCMDTITKQNDYFNYDIDALKVGTGFWQSTTPAYRAESCDKLYYLPIREHKQCVQVQCVWPDHRRRMYNSNLIANIIEIFEEGFANCEVAIKNENHDASIQVLKSTLEAVSDACASYVHKMSNAPHLGNTNLDRERQKLCSRELGNLVLLTKNLRTLITKHSMKDRLRTARNYLNKLKHLCEDAQHSMPDVFIWLISNGKRLAYYRIPAREIIYSEVPDEIGKYCAKMQQLFLRWPGKKASSSSGWAIPAKLNVYLWLGTVKDSVHYVDGLPSGYEFTSEPEKTDLRQYISPQSIFYAEKHKFQMRAYIYQARSLIPSDATGLSDAFARITIVNSSQKTQVIDQTLSPTWDETLVFENITLYSTIENIKADPPTVVIEIFDQDCIGKSQFIGRSLVKPFIKSLEDIRDRPPSQPALEWHDIRRGDEMAGELLATFELLELAEDTNTEQLPALPSPQLRKQVVDLVIKGPILPVPQGIRPTLSIYRIEVIFWGLRDLKRVHFQSVDKPRVDIECSGHILTSTVIQNGKSNPNFNNSPKFIDLELPDQDIYKPPLTIRVVDCRSFGRHTLVGTHTINLASTYVFTPMSKIERSIEDRKRSLIKLQNVDLQANCLIQEDVFTTHENENIPLLTRTIAVNHGWKNGRSPRRTQSLDSSTRGSQIQRKANTDSTSNEDDGSGSTDWWSKYYASYDVMIEENNTNKTQSSQLHLAQASMSAGIPPRCAHSNSLAHCGSECGGARRKTLLSPKKGKKKRSMSTSSMTPPMNCNIKQIPKSALTKVYPHELESVPEYEEFKEWLHTFDLYRGKKTEYDSDDENRVVGSFKGAIKVYKWPLPKGFGDSTIMGQDPNYGLFQGVPTNEPTHVLVRIYIVKATDLHPMDINGKADPFISLTLGNTKIKDLNNYVSKQLNPIFGKCYEIEATFPQDSNLTITIIDWDQLRPNELIGETSIDLENRFYSRHRATCGLPKKYEEMGYNRWRDSLKPTQILAKLCKDGKLEPPVYEQTRVKVGRTIFNMPSDEPELISNPDNLEEQMALVVLHRWYEVPRVGCHLVKEHVETRSLYNPNKPGIEQGRLEMWVDMFPMDMPAPGPPLDIAPRKPTSYELRVIIWNTEDVVLEDDAFFTGEKMSDIYVKGWLNDPVDCQSTDIHFRSLTGEGNFNWRFVYPFEYMEAEQRIVRSLKYSVLSWDQTLSKNPARLELQVWDSDHFTNDDFLGALTLNLNRFPRGAKSANKCSLEMLCNDGTVPMVNIFKQKRVRGWWPFYIMRGTDEMELTGKVEAEIILLTREEADRQPAGRGHEGPDALDKPNRPDSSFMWFLTPLRSARYILWRHHKWSLAKWGLIACVCLGGSLAYFSIPVYSVKAFLGA